jgi:hypothetical protein
MVNVNCRVRVTSSLPCSFCQSPCMIFGVSPTKDAIVIARTRGWGETFVIKDDQVDFSPRRDPETIWVNSCNVLSSYSTARRQEPRLDHRTPSIVVASLQVFHRSNQRRSNHRTRDSWEWPTNRQGNSREPQKGPWLRAGAEVQARAEERFNPAGRRGTPTGAPVSSSQAR